MENSELLFDFSIEEVDNTDTEVEIEGILFDRKQDAETIAAVLADYCDRLERVAA